MKRVLKQLTGLLCAVAIVFSPVATCVSRAAGAADFKHITNNKPIPPIVAALDFMVGEGPDGIPMELPISDRAFEYKYMELYVELAESPFEEVAEFYTMLSTELDSFIFFFTLSYFYDAGLPMASAEAYARRYMMTDLQAAKDVFTVMQAAVTTPAQPAQSAGASAPSTAAAPASGKAWAYLAQNVNSAKRNIGGIFYTLNYYNVIRQAGVSQFINPATNKKYTDAQVDAIVNGALPGAAGYAFGAPDTAVSALSPHDNSRVFWYDAEATLAMLQNNGKFILNSANGVVTDAAGNVIAMPMK